MYARLLTRGFASVRPGRVARIALDCPDSHGFAPFFQDALGLKPQQVIPGRYGLGDGSSCGIMLVDTPPVAGEAAAPGGSDKKLTYPYLTVGVSNLKTAARHARRRGGAVREYFIYRTGNFNDLKEGAKDAGCVIPRSIKPHSSLTLPHALLCSPTTPDRPIDS